VQDIESSSQQLTTDARLANKGPLPELIDAVSARSAFKKSEKNDLNRATRAAQLQQEYYENSEGLTKAQQEYESKTVPKFYKPVAMERRVQFFENNIAKIKKSTKPQAQLYVCASFNDWIPMRMKTMRTLMLERYPMNYPPEEIPKQVYTLDNTNQLCAQMVPPGVHFFYFTRQKGSIFLSPSYDVVRFKSTNIFLNRIKVSKRLEEIQTVHIAKDGEEDEVVFMKDRSVFRDYREDTEAFLKKCFDEDYQFGKLGRFINKKGEADAEENAVKDLLFSEYKNICNIFDYYSGTSSYPTISMNDFTSFSNQVGILDQNYIGLSQLDLLLVATCVSTNPYVNSAEKDLQRYEFLEMIVRIADFRFK